MIPMRIISLLIVVVLLTGQKGFTQEAEAEEEIVTYNLYADKQAKPGDVITVKVVFSVKKGWHLYAPNGANASMGKIETNMVFNPKPPFKRNGKLVVPQASSDEGHSVLKGDSIVFYQNFTIDPTTAPGEFTLTGKLTHQVCTSGICLPPVTEPLKIVVHVAGVKNETINISDYTVKTIQKEELKISTLRGKVVLIDCWATWCGPCIKEFPKIKALYEKYRDQGFEVVGISMDEATAKERVLNILKQYDVSWTQGFEGTGFQENSFTKQFGIKSLPTVFLIDREGKIVSRDARGESLESLIQQQLNQ
jgi:thiol-disulfide isomerase/thioredoxin